MEKNDEEERGQSTQQYSAQLVQRGFHEISVKERLLPRS